MQPSATRSLTARPTVSETGARVCVSIASYVSLSVLGYLSFGDAVARSVTLGMPRTEVHFLAVIPLFALAISLNYGPMFQMLVGTVLDLLARTPLLHGEHSKFHPLVEPTTRIVLVLTIRAPKLSLENWTSNSNF